MMAMYSHYTVIGSKISVNVINGGGPISDLGIVLKNTNSTLSGTSTTVLREQPGTTFRLLSPLASGPTNLVKGFSAKKFFGQKAIVGQDLYRGDVSTNPTEQAYFHVMLGPQGGDDVSATILWVTLEYTAVLTEPVSLAPS